MTITHLDAPCHSLWRSDPGDSVQLYNGQSAKAITSQGAAVGSIELAGDGIVSRGLLLDIAGLYRSQWLDPGTEIFPDDLDAAEAAEGIWVEPGDILFIRTGHPARRIGIGPVEPFNKCAGVQAACLPWLRARDVAVLCCDTSTDVGPMRYAEIGHALHGVGIAGLGLWIVDDADFELLAQHCRRLERWQFMVSISPLKWDKGTGSPVNPIAIL